MANGDLEARVAAALSDGQTDRAVTDTLRTLGPEVLGFLHATARDEATASEAFSRFSVDVWRGLSGFKHRASLRAWCYVVARRALYRASRTRGREDQLTSVAVANVAERVRTETLPFLRTEVKAKLTALRDELDEDDRVLLTLRIDRKMAWRDLAEVFLQRDLDTLQTPTDVELAKASATLRKRFERVKTRLKRLAAERGLIGPG